MTQDPIFAHHLENLAVLADVLTLVTAHFADTDGMPDAAARALAHKVLDIKPERWAAVQAEARRNERAARADMARFRRRCKAVTAASSGAVQQAPAST